MSYFYRSRSGMGDGPITDPSQVDTTVVPIVPPTRVECAALPADSPWRGPGQVCAAPAPGGGMLDSLQSLISGAAVGPVGEPGTVTIDLLRVAGLAALGYLGYRYITKRKRA